MIKGTFEAPRVTDFGTLVELTEAVYLFGAEDGASKLLPFHHVLPSGPAGP